MVLSPDRDFVTLNFYVSSKSLKPTSRIVINDPRMKDMSSPQILPSEATGDALNPPP